MSFDTFLDNTINNISSRYSKWKTERAEKQKIAAEKAALKEKSKNSWKIIRKASFSETHFRRCYENTSLRYDERDVIAVYVIEENEVTKEQRAKVMYGNGSLFEDKSIDVVKAHLVIDGFFNKK